MSSFVSATRRPSNAVHTVIVAMATLCIAAAGTAQIPQAEYNARRDSLAAKLGDGMLVAFGGRTPVSDFGPFFQLPDFRYLANYNEPDAALVMVIRGGKAQSTLFITAAGARQAFYYGKRPDSLEVERTLGMRARSAGVIEQVIDSLATSVNTVYTVRDFAAADFATQDSSTRGQLWERRFAAAHPQITMRDAHPYLYQIRAKKSAAELALIRKAAEISSEGHRAAMRLSQPTKEFELQAAIEYEFTRVLKELAYGKKTLMSGLFGLIRSNHPAFADLGPRKDEILEVLKSMSRIMDMFNPVRNESSMAHPNKYLLDPPEAALVINTARTILHYLDLKLSAYSVA